MDGLSRVIGVGTGIRLSGQTYWCRPMTLARLSSCEQYLLSGRQSPDDAVRLMVRAGADRNLIAEIHQMAVDEIKRDKSTRVVEPDELYEWLYTPKGLAFSAWICLRRCRFARTVESAEKFFGEHTEDALAFARVRDMVSGIDLLSALDWPAPAVYPDDHPKRGQPIPQPTLSHMPWKKLASKLAEARNWGPREIGRLTLYSLKVYSTNPDDASLGGKGTIDARDARQLAQMTPDQRKRNLFSRTPEGV